MRLILIAFVAVGIGGLFVLGGGVVAESPSNTSNDTVHEHPDETGGDGDLHGVADWLGGDLGSMLGDSAVEISEGQYETASSLIGDEYDQRLSEYVTIAGDTNRDRDSPATETFGEAQEAQHRYIDLSQRFESTFEAYEQAIEDGDEERARELRRELETIAAELDEESATIQEAYERLEELIGIDLSDESEAIADHTEEILVQVEDADEVEFQDTTITAETDQDTISTVEPLVVSGSVETTAGETVDGGTVVLSVADDEVTAPVEADGTFEVTYRPVLTPLETDEAAVAYEPEPASPYRGSNASMGITIEQVSAALTLGEEPSELRYGEVVSVSGTLSVEGEPLTSVPVRITVGETVLTETATARDGTIQTDETLGSSPPDGDHTLTLELPFDDRAISAETASAPVTVLSSETTMEVQAEEVDPGEVAITGTLTTEDGTPVTNEQVVVHAEGTAIETVSTDEDGTFALTRDLDNADDDTIEIGATFDGSDSNLVSSEATTTVGISVSQGGSTITDQFSDRSTTLVYAVAVGLFLMVSYLLYRRGWLQQIVPMTWQKRGGQSFERLASRFGGGDSASSSKSDIAASSTQKTTSTSGLDGSGWLAQAEQSQQAGKTEEAIQLAYLGTRREVGAHLANGDHATHWEFYRACQEIDLPTIDRLEVLTSSYELAQFAPRPASPEEAEDALAAARDVIDGTH